MVECLPVDPATWVRFPAGAVKDFCSMTMAPTINNPSYDHSVHKYFPWIHFHVIPVPRNSGTNFKLEGVNLTGYMYIIHFYCLAVEAGFYRDVVESLPVDPATWVSIHSWSSKILSLNDNQQMVKVTSIKY